MSGGFTAPVDGDAGGTWIAARDSGVVLALLNHQPARPVTQRRDVRPDASPAARRRVDGHRRRVRRRRAPAAAGWSPTLAAERAIPDAARLRAAGLAAFAPFRLFVAGPSAAAARVHLERRGAVVAPPGSTRGFLTSSSWNSRAVIPARQARFRRFARDHRQPTRADLVAFHARTDDPRGRRGRFCMAREDACTVSTTVVEAGTGGVSMRYRAR